MKIHEFQAMALFREYGISTAACKLADSPDNVPAIWRELGPRLVIKAQVLAGGRGKAGGIRRAHSAREAEEITKEILSMRIKSMPVKSVLIAQACDILKEYYLGITIDRTHKKIICMMSASGGMEIEEVARNTPEKIVTVCLGPLKNPDEARLTGALGRVFRGGDFTSDKIKDFTSDKIKDFIGEARDTVLKMHKLFIEKDCSLVEINPYACVLPGKLTALDAKINFDDSALFKHPEIESLKDSQEHSLQEIMAREAGLSFVAMDGTIGCIVNGAGLAMATMDMIKLFGGEPANFLDVGGSSSPGKVLQALKIILSHEKIKAILINIFGGITRCDDIANGIVMAAGQIDITLPLVIRLIGTNEAEGRNILTQHGFLVVKEMNEAVKRAVEAVKLA